MDLSHKVVMYAVVAKIYIDLFLLVVNFDIGRVCDAASKV